MSSKHTTTSSHTTTPHTFSLDEVMNVITHSNVPINKITNNFNIFTCHHLDTDNFMTGNYLETYYNGWSVFVCNECLEQIKQDATDTEDAYYQYIEDRGNYNENLWIKEYII